MILILLGAPGSGKGTQAMRLVNQFDFIQLSTGDIFRRHIKNKTSLGILVQQYLDQGQLVPDKVTNDLVAEELKHHLGANVIFDGYPRTLEQAKALDKLLVKHHQKIDSVANLHASDSLIIDRLSNRLICPQCQRTYQKKSFNNQPLLCTFDGTKLIRRPDDEPEKVKTRLVHYHNETKPLINYYRQQNLLVNVDESADESADDIYLKLLKALKLNNDYC